MEQKLNTSDYQKAVVEFNKFEDRRPYARYLAGLEIKDLHKLMQDDDLLSDNFVNSFFDLKKRKNEIKLTDDEIEKEKMPLKKNLKQYTFPSLVKEAREAIARKESISSVVDIASLVEADNANLQNVEQNIKSYKVIKDVILGSDLKSLDKEKPVELEFLRLNDRFYSKYTGKIQQKLDMLYDNCKKNNNKNAYVASLGLVQFLDEIEKQITCKKLDEKITKLEDKMHVLQVEEASGIELGIESLRISKNFIEEIKDKSDITKEQQNQKQESGYQR